MAFLALLVVAVVSTLIITAASASAGRVVNRTEQQQVMIASQSVAEILADSYNAMDPVTMTGNEWVAVFEVPYGSYFSDSAASILKNCAQPSPAADYSAVFSSDGEIPEDIQDVEVTVQLVMGKPGATLEKVQVSGGSTIVPDSVKESLGTVCVVTAEKGDNRYSTSIILAADVHGLTPLNRDVPKISLRWYVSEISKGDSTRS